MIALPIFLLGLGVGLCLSGILCAAVGMLGPRKERDGTLGTSVALIGAACVFVIAGVHGL